MSARPTDSPQPTFLSLPDGGSAPNVLLPVRTACLSDTAIKIAGALAQTQPSTLHVLSPIILPTPAPLDAPEQIMAPRRALIRKTIQQVEELAPDNTLHGIVRTGRGVTQVLIDTIKEQNIGTIIIDESQYHYSCCSLRRTAIDILTARTDCDVIVVNERANYADLASLLVPVAGGPHSASAVAVGYALSQTTDAWVDLLHILDEGASDQQRNRAKEFLLAKANQFNDFERISTWIVTAGDVEGAIIEHSQYYDATIIGAPQKSRLRRFVFSSPTADIYQGTQNTVIVTQKAAEPIS